MTKALANYSNQRMILGAYEAYLDCMTEEDAIRRTCEKYSISPELLKWLAQRWNELVAAGDVDLTISETDPWPDEA